MSLVYHGETVHCYHCVPVRGVREDEFPAPRRGHGGNLCPRMGRLEERHRWTELREGALTGRWLGIE